MSSQNNEEIIGKQKKHDISSSMVNMNLERALIVNKACTQQPFILSSGSKIKSKDGREEESLGKSVEKGTMIQTGQLCCLGESPNISYARELGNNGLKGTLLQHEKSDPISTSIGIRGEELLIKDNQIAKRPGVSRGISQSYFAALAPPNFKNSRNASSQTREDVGYSEETSK